MRLEKHFTYVVGGIAPAGSNLREKAAQECPLPFDYRWVHVAVCFFDDEWKIVQAEIKRGVVEESLRELLARCQEKGIVLQAVPHPIIPAQARSFIGMPFGLEKVLWIEKGKKNGRFSTQQPMDGMTCAELVLRSMDATRVLWESLPRDPNVALPIHLQKYPCIQLKESDL